MAEFAIALQFLGLAAALAGLALLFSATRDLIKHNMDLSLRITKLHERIDFENGQIDQHYEALRLRVQALERMATHE